jgi:hypothetical protein
MSQKLKAVSKKGSTKRAQGRRTKPSADLTTADRITARTLAAIMRDAAAGSAAHNEVGRELCDLQNETRIYDTDPDVIAHAYLAAVAEARRYIAGEKKTRPPAGGRPQLLRQHIQTLTDIAANAPQLKEADDAKDAERLRALLESDSTTEGQRELILETLCVFSDYADANITNPELVADLFMYGVRGGYNQPAQELHEILDLIEQGETFADAKRHDRLATWKMRREGAAQPTASSSKKGGVRRG